MLIGESNAEVIGELAEFFFGHGYYGCVGNWMLGIYPFNIRLILSTIRLLSFRDGSVFRAFTIKHGSLDCSAFCACDCVDCGGAADRKSGLDVVSSEHDRLQKEIALAVAAVQLDNVVTGIHIFPFEVSHPIDGGIRAEEFLRHEETWVVG